MFLFFFKVGHFLADSGSACSLLPARLAPSVKPCKIAVTAANNSAIHVTGTCTLTFALPHLSRTFTWTFYVADVAHPILGKDFLQHRGFAVDCVNDRLISVRRTELCGNINAPLVSFSHIAASIWEKYNKLFDSLDTRVRVSHGVEHHISTSGPPCFSKVRRLAGEKLKIAKQTFLEWERQGIVYRGESSWASPLHMAPKADDKMPWRPVGDYRRLNLITVPDRYPMPNLNDISNDLEDCTVFSKLDLVQAFTQIPVAEADQPKTAVITPFGLFIFRRMFFGFRNAAQTFQRMMDAIFRDTPFVKVYLDDILISSTNPEEHKKHLTIVLDRLLANGLRLRKDKCYLFCTKVQFVGVEISASGLKPLESKLTAISCFEKPTITKGLKCFLGLAGFYHKFVPGFSRIAAPLTEMLRDRSEKGNQPLTWNETSDAAFLELKLALRSSVRLAFPARDGKLELTTDASEQAAGAVLNQIVNGTTQPIAFFFRPNLPNYRLKSRRSTANCSRFTSP